MDAILDQSDAEHPSEPEWPETDFIVGNPPFLGGKLLRTLLGDEYVDRLFKVWNERVPREADLCCYWFEKGRQMVEHGKARRAGLLATQGIRGGANRAVLKRIKDTGDIFFAESDREWFLDGANVHVSMVGFDDGAEQNRILDGHRVSTVNANLSASADTTIARRLTENLGICFMGDTKGGAFDINDDTAKAILVSPNPHGRPNSDVLVPWINGLDITRRLRFMWIIDFGVAMPLELASQYEAPFAHVVQNVKDERSANKRETYRNRWWIHVEPRPALRSVMSGTPRSLVTASVSKHRLFTWINGPTLPDHQLFAIVQDDDYLLGVLHSKIHEVWARTQGTQVRERESGFRYTPTSCLETFAFPSSDASQGETIGKLAKELNELRERWLNPPEWTRDELLEFPGSVDGPWRRFVFDPNSDGVGTVRFPRKIAKDAECAKSLAKRTLTNLYNERPTWLDLAHRKLDEAVCNAYGWPADISDDDILARLLDLNLSRAAAEVTV